jgi:hypothetical protein
MIHYHEMTWGCAAGCEAEPSLSSKMHKGFTWFLASDSRGVRYSPHLQVPKYVRVDRKCLKSEIYEQLEFVIAGIVVAPIA